MKSKKERMIHSDLCLYDEVNNKRRVKEFCESECYESCELPCTKKGKETKVDKMHSLSNSFDINSFD